MKKFHYLIFLLTLVLMAVFPPAWGGIQSNTEIIKSKITIEIIPGEKKLRTIADLDVISSGDKIKLFLNKSFKILDVVIDGKKSDYSFNTSPDEEVIKKLNDDNINSDYSKAGILEIKNISSGKRLVKISYEGIVYEQPSTSEFSREYIANQTTGIISSEGTFLSPESFWYPSGNEEMNLFEVITLTPAGYETVTQGTRIRRELTSANTLLTHWKNDNPADVLYLQAGPYEIKEDEIDGIKIYTYFFKGGEDLAKMYLSKSKYYIEMYNQLLGKYPYNKFAVVENFFETGFGMPSWTLLGRTVVRLPFIPDTSLPHEICHNWWGNGVFVDYDRGNWCEGLTVYCADYLLKEKSLQDGGAEYRIQTNRDYASYVKDNNDFPLSEFKSRYDPASRAIGYGKSMMVFHDLQRIVGRDQFFETLRYIITENKFNKLSWNDILAAFERKCDIKLDFFLKQWIKRKGTPILFLESVMNKQDSQGRYIISFRIGQKGDVYRLNVPIQLITDKNEIYKEFSITDTLNDIVIESDDKPLLLRIDPYQHIFRQLYEEEIPPSIATIFGSHKQIIILPSGNTPDNAVLIESANIINKTKTGIIKYEDQVTSDELEKTDLILLGKRFKNPHINNLLKQLLKDFPWKPMELAEENAGIVVVFRNPISPNFKIMLLDGNSKSDLKSIARKLPHYGKYSYLLFSGDTNKDKGIFEIKKSPLMYSFD